MLTNLKGDDCFKILDKEKYILFFFTASWCGPCKLITPTIEKWIEKINEQELQIYKIDIEENDELCQKCNINSVPTFILFKDRKAIDIVKGANEDKLFKMLSKYIKIIL